MTDPRKTRAFENLQVKFQVEMINSFAQHVTLTLHEVKSLNCVMRTGSVGNFKQIVMTGPVDFRLIAAVAHDDTTRNRAPRIKLRLEPKQREEYRYAEIFTQDMDGFIGVYYGSDEKTIGGNWDSIYSLMLQETESSTGQKYQELIDLAVELESKKVMAENINSHALYASL